MEEFIVIDQRDMAQEGSFPTLEEAIVYAQKVEQKFIAVHGVGKNGWDAKGAYRLPKFWIERRELVWSSDRGLLTD